jgi:hypothetical protein
MKGFRALLVLLMLSAVFAVYYGIYTVAVDGSGIAHAAKTSTSSATSATSAPDDNTNELKLDIPKGESANEIVANKGFIIVKSAPSMASIYINGKFQGETPLKLSLNPGTHRLTLKIGAVTWNDKVRVEKGRTRVLKKYL